MSAMSILSSTSAELSGSWMMNISLFKNSKKSGEVAAENKSTTSGELSKQRLPSPSSSQGEKKQEEVKGWRPRTWFAPEFDGLNCFETIVSH